MKTTSAAVSRDMTMPWLGGLLVPLLLTMTLFTGCSRVQRAIVGEEPKTHAEIAVQSPPVLGTVTGVGSALMLGKELRRGDIALTVEQDDGQVIVVIQPEDNIYTPGDRVRIIRDGKGLVTAQVL